jgi:hypothetical protein
LELDIGRDDLLLGRSLALTVGYSKENLRREQSQSNRSIGEKLAG